MKSVSRQVLCCIGYGFKYWEHVQEQHQLPKAPLRII